MRTRDLILSLAAGVTLLVGVAFAQPNPDPQKPAQPAKPAEGQKNQQKPAPAPDSLEALMADAMKLNPNIQAAETSLREAQSKLNKVRNEVLIDVASAHKVLTKAREVLRQTEELHKMREELHKKGNLSSVELAQGRIEVARAQATVASQEADLMKLVGRVPGQPEQHTTVQKSDSAWVDFVGDPSALFNGTTTNRPWVTGTLYPTGPYALMTDGSVRWWDVNNANTLYLHNFYNSLATYNPRVNAPAASIADKITEALKKPIKIEKDRRDTVKNALNFLKQQGLKDVPVRMLASEHKVFEMPAELMAGELPLSAWLQAVQDSAPELRFVVREYGLLVTTADRAPPDGLLLGEFLRRTKAEKPKEEKKDEKKEEKPK